MYKVVMIPGDGIGPEVSNGAMRIMEATGVQIEWVIEEAGEAVYHKTGALVPDSVYAAIEETKVALKGPITTPVGTGFKSINVSLRQKYDLYANVRPVISYAGLSKAQHVDMVIFRENTEDLYMGLEQRVSDDEVHGIKVITRKGSTRIAEAAFEYAQAHGRKRVSAVHKANIMKLADGLFLDACRKVAEQYPEIAYDEVIVDNMCMQMVMYPDRYDVILTENLYGDILSDLAAGLVGGLGLVPGSNIGKDCAIFEAVHGSAPDIAGKGLANPIAMTLSGAMLLDYLGEYDAARWIREAVKRVMSQHSALTPDLGGTGTTETLTAALCKLVQDVKGGA